jgi:gamma-glutamyltranspeptidase/glutathione hydrolase/leukotriene-C4 hydrolase
MDDFSSPNITNYFGVPPSRMNQIAAGKRPLSSMCPVVVTHRTKDTLLSLGAAGGTLIISGMAQTLVRILYMNQNLKESIDQYRIHHQLFPNELAFEPHFDQKLLETLHNRYGHKVTPIKDRRSVLTGVHRLDNKYSAYTDFRKGGSIDGL